MKIRSVSFLLFLSVLSGTGAACAATYYISDQLIVAVRTNTGNQYDILERLSTGTAVDVLGTEKNFYKVKTAKGSIGYIPQQYLNKQLPKAEQIEKLQDQNTQLQEKLQNLEAQYQQEGAVSETSQAEIDAIKAELHDTRQQLESTSKAYSSLQEKSQDVISIANERDQLTEENKVLSSQLSVLEEENRSVHRSNMIKWFLAGGGVFFFGWLAGKLSRKKRGYSRY